MLIAAIIPFRGNPDICRWALEGFAVQELPADCNLEVRVCGDGMEPPLLPPELLAAAEANRITFSFRTVPHSGASEAKNALLYDWPADIVIFANSDTRPAADFVRIHAETLSKLPFGSMVLGFSPWEKPASPTVLDALFADTPMIFFYNQMRPHQSYDFRHAWTLNLSTRYVDAMRAGGFEKYIRPVYYDDLVLGHRILGSNRKNIFYEPAAQSSHRHPTTLDQYFNREELLGLMLPVLARNCPEIFAALYPDHTLADLVAEARAWINMDIASHRWIYQRLQEWSALPESVLGDPASPDTTRLKLTIFQMHIPLKRFAFRLGLLRGLDMVDDAHWQQRTAANTWKNALGI